MIQSRVFSIVYKNNKGKNKTINVDSFFFVQLACLAITATLCGISIAGFLSANANETQLSTGSLDLERLQVEVEQLLSVKLKTINGVSPETEQPSKKRATNGGGVDFIGVNGILVETTTNVEIGIDENVLQRRIANACSSEEFAVAVMSNGQLVCEMLSANIARLGLDNRLAVETLPLTVLKHVGLWDANLNSPTIQESDCPSTYSVGSFFTVFVDGNTELNGYSNFTQRDWLICTVNGFEKNTHGDNDVLVVNGFIGDVILDHLDLLSINANEHVAHSTIMLNTGSLLTGGGTDLTTNVTFGVDPSVIQRRINIMCTGQETLNAVAQDGTGTCVPTVFNPTYNSIILSADINLLTMAPSREVMYDVTGFSHTLAAGTYLIGYRMNVRHQQGGVMFRIVDQTNAVILGSRTSTLLFNQDWSDPLSANVVVSPTVSTTYKVQVQRGGATLSSSISVLRAQDDGADLGGENANTVFWYLKLA